MGNRVVKLLITAEVNSFLSGTAQVAKATREARSEADALTARLEAQRKAFDFVGKTMLAAGGVVAAGLILATKRAADFDQAMSNVQAATHETAENMGLLRDAALDAGAETVYSAKEAAGAIEELAKAGLSTQSIIGGGLTGALDLAAAGGLDVADAAGIASTTLQQFGLSGDKASHVADVLAAGAGKAMGDVSDLSQALSQSGTVAAQFGLSLEETTGSLAAFASKGLLGSDAGTSFRSMLLRLANPTGEAAKKMQELGIQAYDAQGNFVGMTGLAGQLEKGLGKLTQEQRNAALSIIFGQDAIRAANVLYTEGAAGIAKWTKEVDDAGYAGETAATRLDNLNGDLEKLSGAFDTAMITIGGAGQGPLRAAVQGITELVDGFNGMPEGAQTAVYWVGAAASAGALAGGAFLLAVPKVAEFKSALGDLSPATQRFAGALGAVAKWAGIAGAAFTVMSVGTDLAVKIARDVNGIDDAIAKATTTNQSFLDSMGSLGTVTEASADKVRSALNNIASGNVLGGAGTEIQELRDSLTYLGEGLEAVPLEDAADRVRGWAKELGLSKAETKTLISEIPGFEDAIRKQLAATGAAADEQAVLNFVMGKSKDVTKTAADAYLEQSEQVNGVRDALRQLYDEMNAGNSAQQTAIQANADFVQGLAEVATGAEAQRKAFEEANGTLDGFALSLDQSTAAGSANAAMLAGLAGDAQTAAQAQYEVDQKTMGADEAAQKYAATLADQKQKFVDSAVAAGYSAGEVQALADKVFALPSSKQIDVLAKTAGAQSQIDGFIRDYSGRTIPLYVTTMTDSGGRRPLNVGMYADGGPIFGPGGPRDDRVPAMLSNGEHVLTAAEVRRAGGHGAIYAMRAAIMSGVPRYAEGGPVYAQNFTFAGLPSVGSQVTIRQDIHPAPRMSESELARIVAEKTQFAVRGA